MADKTRNCCAELRAAGEYDYQRAVLGKTHDEAAVLARKAALEYLPPATQRNEDV